MERIKFIKLLRFGVASALVSPLLFSSCSNPNVPSYLKGYEDLYADSPRKATLNYFRNAKFGLFIHYGFERTAKF